MDKRTVLHCAFALAVMVAVARADGPAAAPDRPAATTAPALSATGLTLPADLVAVDKPNDNGKAIVLLWTRQPCESLGVTYELLASTRPDGPFHPQGRLSAVPVETGPYVKLKSDMPESFGYKAGHLENGYARGCTCENCASHAIEVSRVFGPWAKKPEDREVRRDQPYYFRLQIFRESRTAAGEWLESPRLTTATVSGTGADNWFAITKVNVAVATIIITGIVMVVIVLMRRNPHTMFIRRIGGLEAIDDALGRAAEMGKPVFFCYGQGGLGDVVTISSMNILGKVGEKVGEYGTEMKVTCMDYLVMQASQEMVKEAYTRVGRPDHYKDENIFYVTGDPFSYAAATGAMLIRENAGTVFFMGHFTAESLLLTETGAVTKAIQIGGTDSFNQIPFFITTCDYTLIGEELYAASACLSHEPKLVATIKGQDIAKALIMSIVIVGTALASVGWMWFSRLFWPL